nr:MAG TPA: hypothetical protein [Caudoviricetes sp.]
MYTIQFTKIKLCFSIKCKYNKIPYIYNFVNSPRIDYISL